MRLIWRPSALAQIESIASFIAARNPVAAERIASLIERTAEGLVDHPHIYRRGRVDGTREAIAHPNYILIYRVLADAVEIIGVLHTRQNYP